MRALALIDGEHYAPVVRAALEELPYDFVAAHVVGGTEKLRGDADYGVGVAADLDAALAEHRPELVVDLSDEPVLGPRERFRLREPRARGGAAVCGGGFPLRPARARAVRAPVDRDRRYRQAGRQDGDHGPMRRISMRASARSLSWRWAAVGRRSQEVTDVRPDLDQLLALSRDGRHAASDYLETAALAGVTTVGCRRCGGGLAGAVAVSNVLAGVRLAEELDPDLIVLDGSGAAIPPVAADRRILVVGAQQGSRRRHRVPEPVPRLVRRPRGRGDGGGRCRARAAPRPRWVL